MWLVKGAEDKELEFKPFLKYRLKKLWCLRKSGLGEALEIAEVIKGEDKFCVEYKLICLNGVLAGESRGWGGGSFEACD